MEKSPYDILESQAMWYGAGVQPGTKLNTLTTEQKERYDEYMKKNIRLNPEAYKNDTRANKYLKDMSQSDFDAMRQQEINDGVNPGGFWRDFGAGDLGEYGGALSGYRPDESEETGERERAREDLRNEDKDENTSESNNAGEDVPEETPEADEEPSLGEDADRKKVNGDEYSPDKSSSTASRESARDALRGSDLGESTKAASNVAKAVGGASEGAGASAVGGVAALGSEAGVASGGWIGIIVIAVIFVLVFLWAFFVQNPDSAQATENTCVSVDGHVFPLPKEQVTYGDGFGDSRSDHLHSGTDLMHKKDLKVEVYAITDGTIVSAKTSTDGASLKLKSTNPNDSKYYFYTHFSSITVTKGATVSAGQLIGYSGGYNEGANGDHIHLSVGAIESFTVNLPLDSGAKHGQTAAPSPYESTLNPYPILKAIESGSSECVSGSVGQYGLPVQAGAGFTLGSAFGPREKPCDSCSSNHKGQDISIPGTKDVGKPVYAVEAGKITNAYYSSCALYKVTIDHGGGFVTKYYHLTKGGFGGLTVGSNVTKGQQIGTISSNANDTCSTGPHLHFETWINGVAKNPVGIVDFSKL